MKIDIDRIMTFRDGHKVLAGLIKKSVKDPSVLIKLAEHLTNGRDHSSPDPKSARTRIATITKA